jgi:hypothetical protein
MTTQPISPVEGQSRSATPEPRHKHVGACYWDVDDCRWQCATYPGVRYALEHCTAIGRPVADTGTERRP